jgi:hypothetical protein
MKKIGFVFRTLVVLTLVVGAGIYCVPDAASLKTALFALAITIIITGTIILVLGVKERWGVLPGIDFPRDVKLAMSTPQSSATVILGFLIFLGLLMIAIFKAA